MVPSVKSEPAPTPVSAPGHRLRREALRLLAQKLEGATLSSTRAENLLAEYVTLEDSLRAVRAQMIRRASGKFGSVGELSAELPTFQPLWSVRAAAAFQLCLIALFLQRMSLGIDVTAGAQFAEPVLYVIAWSFGLLALAVLWRGLRHVARRR